MAPPRAEQVAHRRVGGVTQARVLHRPGRERDREQHGEHDQRHTGGFAHAPAQRVTHPVGEEGQTVEGAFNGRHASPLAEHRHQAMQRLRRGRAILHHGDADEAVAGIAAVGLIAREITAGDDTQARLPP